MHQKKIVVHVGKVQTIGKVGAVHVILRETVGGLR